VVQPLPGAARPGGVGETAGGPVVGSSRLSLSRSSARIAVIVGAQPSPVVERATCMLDASRRVRSARFVCARSLQRAPRVASYARSASSSTSTMSFLSRCATFRSSW